MADKPVSLVRLSATQALRRLLEEPELVRIVQALPAGALARLVDHVGLEDAGEIVSLATTDQVVQLLDVDLWKSASPGIDESFDPDRFVLWLQVLLESGDRLVARKLSEWPEDLVMLAVYQNVLVINLDELALEMTGRHQDVDLTEKALDSCLYFELGEYQIIARRQDGWSAIQQAILALDQHQPGFLQPLLERCCRLSREYIEENDGLYNVLSSGEMLECDAAADREDRRAAQGYISPSSARSFLSLAQVTDLQEIIQSDQEDPVTRAYFRALKSDPPEQPARVQTGIASLLQEAGILEGPKPAALLGDPADADRLPVFQRIVAQLADKAPRLYARRMSELAYLANLLIAGHSLSGRRYRPSEAAEAVIRFCNAGLLHLTGAADSPRDSQVVREESAVKLFRIGWHLSEAPH